MSAGIYNPEKRFYSHAYDESRSMFWCDQATGQSPNVWGRAIGWFAMALVDVLELLKDEPADTRMLRDYIKELIDDMLPYRHRDGSLDYYILQEKIVDNNGHGVAPLLMAYNEIKLRG